VSNTKKCAACSKSIGNHRRPQTKTCGNSCRTRLWRLSNAGPVSLKVVLTKLQFIQLKTEANDLDMMINDLVVAKATQSPAPSNYS
jgi:hypothetical protein